MGNGLNNPFSSALGSLLNNVEGLFTGRNPLTQPQVGELFGFNIQGTPLVSTRDYFLTQLESWVTSIPLQSQWVVLIQPFPTCINTNILQGLERTGGNYNNYDINQAKKLLISHPFQKVNGCLFSQSVTIPEERMAVKNLQISNSRGFLPGVLSDGRQFSNTLTIEFLETNTSFSDCVIIPCFPASEH